MPWRGEWAGLPLWLFKCVMRDLSIDESVSMRFCFYGMAVQSNANAHCSGVRMNTMWVWFYLNCGCWGAVDILWCYFGRQQSQVKKPACVWNHCHQHGGSRSEFRPIWIRLNWITIFEFTTAELPFWIFAPKLQNIRHTDSYVQCQFCQSLHINFDTRPR